jgi:hypothetical protein
MKGKAMETLTDKRRTYTFYVDDAVLDVFGPRIGVYGIAVYTLLARHAKHKQSFPSYKHIMKQLGIGRMTVWRTMDLLIKEGLIHKEQRESTQGDLTSNLYTLLDLSQHHDHGEPFQETSGGSTSQVLGSTTVILPSTTQGLPSTPEVPEGISLKGSHLKDLKPPPIGPPPGGKRSRAASHVATQERRRKTYYPTDPAMQDTLRRQVLDSALEAWVQSKGLQVDLAAEWEHFERKALAKGYQNVDWRRAFMNWLTSPYQSREHKPRQTSTTMDPDTFAAEAAKWKGRL